MHLYKTSKLSSRLKMSPFKLMEMIDQVLDPTMVDKMWPHTWGIDQDGLDVIEKHIREIYKP